MCKVNSIQVTTPLFWKRNKICWLSKPTLNLLYLFADLCVVYLSYSNVHLQVKMDPPVNFLNFFGPRPSSDIVLTSAKPPLQSSFLSTTSFCLCYSGFWTYYLATTELEQEYPGIHTSPRIFPCVKKGSQQGGEGNQLVDDQWGYRFFFPLPQSPSSGALEHTSVPPTS